MFRFALLFLLVASPAVAECPSGSIPDSGIELRRTTPYFSSVFRKTPEGLREEREMDRSSRREHISTVYPHALAVGKRTAANGTLELRYKEPTSELDRLNETEIWNSLVEIYSNDRKAADGVVVLSFERTASERIGSCTYKVWIVRETTEATRGVKTGFLKFYAPDLGLVIRTIRLDAEGNPISEVRYDKIGVAGGK